MKSVLNNLINFSKPIKQIKADLKDLDWDGDGEVLLNRKMIAKVLDRFILKEIDSGELDEWANAIECREDIDYEESHFDEIKQVIFEIANQSIEGVFDTAKAKIWVERLSN
jgi:hypothetical protein